MAWFLETMTGKFSLFKGQVANSLSRSVFLRGPTSIKDTQVKGCAKTSKELKMRIVINNVYVIEYKREGD